MNAKEKAKELVDNYIKLYPSYVVMWQGDIDNAEKNIKKGALIAVDLAIEVETNIFKGKVHNSYWEKVKKEIKKM
jgi:hypothetical protein